MVCSPTNAIIPGLTHLAPKDPSGALGVFPVRYLEVFCIEDASIVEIRQDGTPLKNPFKEVARPARGVNAKKTMSALVKG